MASSSNLFKPNTSSASLGKKAQETGQFVNPPAYPETSGFSGPGATGGRNGMTVQKTPSAKKGRV
ncbi:MAG TPA: hypothetical protein VKP13_09595 [Nitrospira sp.]|nr:hypothetical protein [Nitrospira sp.]